MPGIASGLAADSLRLANIWRTVTMSMLILESLRAPSVGREKSQDNDDVVMSADESPKLLENSSL